MLRLAMPVLAEQLLQMLVSFTDTWLTGHYLPGENYLAAMSVMAYLLWLMSSLFAVVSIGATAVVARHSGARDFDGASKAFNQALLLGVVVAVAVAALAALFGRPLVLALRLHGSAVELVVQYIWIMLPVMPLVMIQQVSFACLRGAGDTVTGLIVMIVVNSANALLSAGLVIGWGPLPELGWAGLAFGTAGGYLVGAIIVQGILLRGRAGIRIQRNLLLPDRAMLRRLLRVGLPGGIDTASITLCHLWFIAIINALGNLQAAAHGVAIRIEALAYLPGTAFQVAAATLAGQYLGARDEHRAGRSVLLAGLAGCTLMTLSGVVFFFGAELLTVLFIGRNQPEVVTLAAPLLQIVSLGMPALAFSMILTGALRGAGDTRWPLVFTVIGFLAVRIPLAYLLAWEVVPIPGNLFTVEGLGWGVRGAWYAMVIDLYVRCALVSYRFFHGGWKKIEV